MATIDPVYSLLPTAADVSYDPLGGTVGIEQADVDSIQAAQRADEITAMSDGVGPDGNTETEKEENAVLSHVRKRNLGY